VVCEIIGVTILNIATHEPREAGVPLMIAEEAVGTVPGREVCEILSGRNLD
jgi:hypothetical protein